MKLEHQNYPRRLPPCKIWFRSDDVGGLYGFFVFFGLFVTRTGRTSGPILTTYTSYVVFSRKDVPFGDFVDNYHCPFSGPEATKTSQKGKWISFFKPNVQNIKTYIIETTSPNRNKFCTVTKTTKCSSWVVQNRVRQIQYGWRPPFWIKWKSYISTTGEEGNW